jgi:hypothetical protein
MDNPLRNALWNFLSARLLQYANPRLSNSAAANERFDRVTSTIWGVFYEEPVDAMPHVRSDRYGEIRERYFAADWNEVYDFVEFFTDVQNSQERNVFVARVNHILDQESAAYRLVAGSIIAMTDSVEIGAVEEAAYEGSTSALHIDNAIANLAARPPDFRGCIVESILAVEAAARDLTGKQDATLSDSLGEIKRRHPLHQTQIAAMDKMYAYTNTDTGLRHAMLEAPDHLDLADAKYMLVICSAFVNLLRARRT